MKIVETAILSTDLAMYFKKRNSFMELVENGEFDWQSEDKKERKFSILKSFINCIINHFNVPTSISSLRNDDDRL